MVEAKKKAAEGQATKYGKEQLLAAQRYAENTDALRVILRDQKTYTLAEVDMQLEKFMQRKVK